MTEEIVVTNADIFTEFAGKDVEVWKKLIGQSIKYQDGLNCELVNVVPHDPEVLLSFMIEGEGEDISRFHASDFSKHFTISHLPISIPDLELIKHNLLEKKQLQQKFELARIEEEKRFAEERRIAEEARRKQKERQEKMEQEKRLQEEREEKARYEFSTLKAKYGLENVKEVKPTSILFIILKKRDEGVQITQSEEEWLASKKYCQEFLGDYYYWLYETTKDPWKLTMAGKYFRKAGKPEKVITKLPISIIGDIKISAALLTNRGGAYKDLGNYKEALECAYKASEYQPDSYYPLNLLGGILYSIGEYKKGDGAFDRADELGAPAYTKENVIKDIFKVGSSVEKKRTAKYLLEKDPEKYKWARHYLI